MLFNTTLRVGSKVHLFFIIHMICIYDLNDFFHYLQTGLWLLCRTIMGFVTRN